MDNKQLVLDFYRDVFNAHDTEPIPRYVAEDYRQHNLTVAQGRAGFEEFCRRFFTLQARHEIELAIAEDDKVAVFVQVSFANGKRATVADIYRIENGLLAEHWDAVQHRDPSLSEPVHPEAGSGPSRLRCRSDAAGTNPGLPARFLLDSR